ncbi:MAG TPA: TraB/GumN family protein [Burkholderiaceae bacterium]|jgi:uncharacterized protein YbaP (TraB family)|nr:TraB/GumN family protein [Burkholderiaceae bacterium]
MNGVRRKFLRSFVGVLLLGVGTAQAQADRGLFWKVEKDGRTSYLLGTVHFWKREWLPLNPTIEKAFAEAKTLAVELDPSKMDMASAAQRMMLGGNETLESRLGKPLYEQTKAEAAKLGVPEAAIATVKPWGVMLMLAATKLQQLGFTPSAGLDGYLIQKAGASGKLIVELESGNQQLAILDGLSPRLQSAMLGDFLANMERTPLVIDDIFVAWKKGDAAGAYALNQKGFNDSEAKREFDDKFLYQRDVVMTRKIEELLRKPGPHFIAVGSLHLVGPKSIVEQLKARGYRVEQI